MDTFSLPAEPTPKQAALEDLVIRWITVLLPVVVIGHLLGAVTLVALLIATNFNILNWLE